MDDEGLTPLQFGIKYGVTIVRKMSLYMQWCCLLYCEEDEKAVLDDHASAQKLCSTSER